ncbi:MAG: BASS family bile acid:Na+ symporter [Psychromonas sp.]|jgi:BASS family bile acid:Na+ symporter
MLEKSIPLLVFFLMFIVGANLKYADIRALAKRPMVLFIATLGQMLMLPFIAWLLIILTEPSTTTAVGLLLVSFCPGGAISNVYSFFAKVNIALSITLTTVNSLLCVILLPVLLSTIFPVLLPVSPGLNELIKAQSLQLTLLLLCPVILGMLLGYFQTNFMNKIKPMLERLGALGLLLLLLSIFIQYQNKIADQFSDLIILAALFTVTSIIAATTFCYFLSLNRFDSGALVFEFPVRNLALVAMIAVSVFNNSEYLLFAAVFFVVQTPIMLLAVFWYRFKSMNLSLNAADRLT